MDLSRVFEGPVAVVGASADDSKYGFKVFHDLLDKGVNVFPVNPSLQELLGVAAYPSLFELPEKPVLVVTVVPPQATEKIAGDVVDAGIGWVWMQPGSDSEKAVKFLKDNDVKVTRKACIMKETK